MKVNSPELQRWNAIGASLRFHVLKDRASMTNLPNTVTLYKGLHWRRNCDGERAKMLWPTYAEEAQPLL
jgi:hypothetical protein